MNSRCSLILVVCLALIAPAAAQADKTPKPKTPKIFITLTDGAMNKMKIDTPITATYAVPTGLTAAKACKGKVAFAAPTGKKSVRRKGKLVKIVVYAKKSGSIKTVDGKCAATATLSLPQSLLLKTVKFTASGKGNSVVKKFSKTSTLVVKLQRPAAVVPPPNITPGPWTVTEQGGLRQWGFTIAADLTVTKRTGRYGDIEVPCPGPWAPRNLTYTPVEEAPFDDPFKIVSSNDTALDNWVNPSNTQEHTTMTFKYNFDSPTTGTGSMQVGGTLMPSSTFGAALMPVAGCLSAEIPVRLSYGGAM